ncbi:ead/Ea22-like family protein [Pseudomonas mosselii]|uniref:ead/Ea22-like family protein n=1 Tax=Pseudomonas mosselii TaxID=78327 RepID=UPI001C70E379|nr:ead/Ea22-like family protein [Pseudomonas mosselii]
MTIDKAKLKALAEAATQSHGARRVEVDHNGVHVIGDGSWKILSAWHTPDGKGAQNAEFAAAASPATVLALLAEIDQLKAENEALHKQLADLSPFKNAPPQDYRASNKCLDCGEYHHGLGNLPCPRFTPVAQSAMAKEASHG